MSLARRLAALRRAARLPALFGALPIALYHLLSALPEETRAATLVLGAAAGESLASILLMLATLALRLYTIVLLPGIACWFTGSRLLVMLEARR